MKQVIMALFCFVSLNLYAQQSVFSDKLFVKRVQNNLDSVYNYHFENSEKFYNELTVKQIGHPFSDLYYSTVLYWKYFPITHKSQHESLYLKSLNQALEKSEQMLKGDENNPDAIFFALMCRLTIMQFFADNGMSSRVITHIGPAYKMINKGFDLTKEISDFNFSTGVYNYYREYYPKTYPVYKPVAYFLPDGNAQKGLLQLEYNWNHGVFLPAESLFFLTYINLYFEKDYLLALKHIKQLNEKFTGNLLYTSYHVQILLLLHKYSETKDLLYILERADHENDFFKTVALLYRAIIIEKTEKKDRQAEKMYFDVLQKLEKYGDFVNLYSSIAYFGLARIYSQKDQKQARKYKKRALDLAVYSHINFD